VAAPSRGNAKTAKPVQAATPVPLVFPVGQPSPMDGE
jgi:hypothetical protein